MNPIPPIATMDVQVQPPSLINTVLFGRTVRATDNRFKEAFVEAQGLFAASLLSLSFLHNNTTTNQGNHCIIAFSWMEPFMNPLGYRMRISEGNQSLVFPNTACKEFESLRVAPRLTLQL